MNSASNTSSLPDLIIAEKLTLLLLNEKDGSITALSSNWRLWCAFVGSVLLDLSFKNRIDCDLDGLNLLDSTPTGDELLDAVLSEISAETNSRTTRFWIETLANKSDDLVDNVLDRLLQRGLLTQDAAGFWSLTTILSSEDEPNTRSDSQELRDRIRRAVLEEDIPDPDEIILIALLQSFGGFLTTLSADEYEASKDRIELLAGLDLFGRAILQAVRTSYEPPTNMLQRRIKPIPKVTLWHALKYKSFRERNTPKFFAEMYEEVGSVFEFALLGRSFIILVGPSANQWASRRGRVYLRTRDYLEDFQTHWGAAKSISSLDGSEHYRMRKIYRAGNSKSAIEGRLNEVFDIGRERIQTWGVNQVLPGEMTMQRITGHLITRLLVSVTTSDEVLDGLLEYEFRSLTVHVMNVLPKVTLRTPKMKRSLAAVLELYNSIHSSHTPAQRENQPPDLVDDLIALHQADPQFLPSTDLEFAFIAPIIAGHYTGSAMSFTLYEVLSNPEILAKVTAEADALFSNGDPTDEDMSMSNIDYTHRVIMEVLRLHPVIPVHYRTAMNAFEIEDFLVPERSACWLSYPSTHFLDEYFENADKFDPDRFAPPRIEHRQTGIYQPFGLGTHTCMGARFTEYLMVLELLLITYHLEIEMVPKNYRLKISPFPKFSPDKKFKFKVKRIRHPIK